ncbi:hypothetical protein GH714_006633 [Hevea brasiliensis]|uniref:Uncharacterized protein n=1 Tax=Hevea brasiliensis TaxID=3981 RepID=A0A6A6LAB9_HEVBR|nr:hypothetical protein GH714_006633 [Hevea brasiliensis]
MAIVLEQKHFLLKRLTKPILEGQGLELFLSRDAFFSQRSTSLVLSELKTSCADGAMDQANSYGGVKDSLTKLLHMDNNGTECQETGNVQQQSLSEESTLKDEKILPDKILPDATVEGVKMIGLKRKHRSAGYLQSLADKSSKERENAARLRVKKIMRRATEEESSNVVQKLRTEIREAVRNKSSADIGESLFDPKLIAAFRTAVAGPTTEAVEKLPPSALKAKKSMLQKG